MRHITLCSEGSQADRRPNQADFVTKCWVGHSCVGLWDEVKPSDGCWYGVGEAECAVGLRNPGRETWKKTKQNK